ncbi:MAG TPA: signal recognition particle receptor subunit alpha, partial [Marinagarivorans sp.]|nr:signal recognition particle receptor subunit alpha [Marinagarivorans sp.]
MPQPAPVLAEPELIKAPAAAPEPEPAPAKPEKLGLFARIKQGLARTTSQFAEGLGNLFLGKKAIDDELLEDLETQLLVADVGIEATSVIIEDLTARVARKQLDDSDALFAALQENLRNLLLPVEKPLAIPADKKPFVILVVGVNGAGKTTTIGKLAHRFLSEGKSVMLAAGDTFRAAAVEQLQVWG